MLDRRPVKLTGKVPSITKNPFPVCLPAVSAMRACVACGSAVPSRSWVTSRLFVTTLESREHQHSLAVPVGGIPHPVEGNRGQGGDRQQGHERPRMLDQHRSRTEDLPAGRPILPARRTGAIPTPRAR